MNTFRIYLISVKEIYSFLMFLFFNSDAESVFVEMTFIL